jgi:hypothetical protein
MEHATMGGSKKITKNWRNKIRFTVKRRTENPRQARTPAVASSSTHYTRNGGRVGSVTKSLDVVGSSFCRKIESNNPFHPVARNPSTRELW